MNLETTYIQEEVTYQSSAVGITLAGTLTMPRGKGPFSAVILVAGFGPNDRDNSMVGGAFRELANYLTSRGIAVLRYDKRGVGASTGTFDLTVTTADLADDLRAGIAYLKGRPEIDGGRIGLIGTSEGGVIASLVAASSPDVAYLVLLAAAVVNGIDEVLEEVAAQLRADGATEELIAHDRQVRKELLMLATGEPDNARAADLMHEAIERYWAGLSDTEKKEAEGLVFTIKGADVQGTIYYFNSPWHRFFLGLKMADIIAAIKVPVLALNGDKDFVIMSRFALPLIREALKRGGNGDHEVCELAGFNHWMQRCATGALAKYSVANGAFDPAVLELVSGWVVSKNQQGADSYVTHDKQGHPIIVEWQALTFFSPDFVKTMASVWDVGRVSYLPVEMEFLRKHPEVVGTEDYYKPFAPLFERGVENVDWAAAEQIMEQMLKPLFVLNPTTLDPSVIALFAHDTFYSVVAKDQKTGELLGFAQFMIRPNYPAGDVKVTYLGVDPACQRRGLGAVLVSSIFKIRPAVTRIFLSTRVTNEGAIVAYRRWGFVTDEHPILDYPCNQTHWIFLEYRADKTDLLQKIAAELQ